MDLPAISDEVMNTVRASAQIYTAVILHRTAKRDEPSSEAIIWEHGRRNIALRAAGVLSIVCPIRDGGNVAGIGIFKGDVAEVTAILEGDPAIQAGILTCEIHACRGFPGDSLPA
ncbi:MAG: hypothetical protein ACRDHX_08670 [Chloroflexota bacterium]